MAMSGASASAAFVPTPPACRPGILPIPPGSAPIPPACAEVSTNTPPEIMRALEMALEMADRLQQEASANAEKIAELTGTAAHWQARALIAEDRVRLLMAPKDEPVEPEPPAEPVRVSWWKRLWG